jgi:hypothetical protein
MEREGLMAKADRKHFGAGVQGKSDGKGAMTSSDPDLPENAVLSNRDKKQHGEERGLDSKYVETAQRREK